jgi:ADP-ribosylglycohydrolase
MTRADRARGCLLALAAGDALGAPTEGWARADIRREHGWIEDFLTDDQAGSDDTEYAVLSAWAALAAGRAATSRDVAMVWQRALSEQAGGFAGAGFSELAALSALEAGLEPPESGVRHVERWSDGAAMRAAPWGLLCAGAPREAARLAAEDARVSHSGDGVFAAEAMAAAVAVGAGGGDWRDALAAGQAALPSDSWTARSVARALRTVEDHPLSEDHASMDVLDEALVRDVALTHYPWADSAPEALALTFGIVASRRGEVVPAILAGVNIGRDSDTIAAMAGAICGAATERITIPDAWAARIRVVHGRCITATAGTDLVALADRLASA